MRVSRWLRLSLAQFIVLNCSGCVSPTYITKQGVSVWGEPPPQEQMEMALDVVSGVMQEYKPDVYKTDDINAIYSLGIVSINVSRDLFRCPDGVDDYKTCSGFIEQDRTGFRVNYHQPYDCLAGSAFVHELMHLHLLLFTNNGDVGHKSPFLWEETARQMGIKHNKSVEHVANWKACLWACPGVCSD